MTLQLSSGALPSTRATVHPVEEQNGAALDRRTEIVALREEVASGALNPNSVLSIGAEQAAIERARADLEARKAARKAAAQARREGGASATPMRIETVEVRGAATTSPAAAASGPQASPYAGTPFASLSAGGRGERYGASSAATAVPASTEAPAAPQWPLDGAAVRLVFLDCDGVISPLQGGDECFFRADKLALLRRIVAAADTPAVPCRVVLSSSWRTTEFGRAEVAKHLTKHGIMPHVACTPDLDGMPRALEILQWIDSAHSDGHCRVVNFVALDDIDLQRTAPDPSFFRRHAVRTMGARGLTDADAERAIALLDGEISDWPKLLLADAADDFGRCDVATLM